MCVYVCEWCVCAFESGLYVCKQERSVCEWCVCASSVYVCEQCVCESGVFM